MSEPFFKAKDFHHPQEGHREHAAAIANAKRDAEIERLREIEASWSGTVDNAERLANQVARLEADNARLREALEFYADAREYAHDMLCEHAFRARAALEK